MRKTDVTQIQLEIAYSFEECVVGHIITIHYTALD